MSFASPKPPSSGGYDRIWYASSGVTAIRGHYLLTVGSKRLALDHVQQQAEAAEILSERYGRFAYVGVREAGTDVRPPPDVRAAMTEVGQRYAPRLVSGALVYEGKGFAATIHRSFATAIQIAARANFPLKVFDSMSAAAYWIEEQVPRGFAMGDEVLLYALRVVRRRAEESALEATS